MTSAAWIVDPQYPDDWGGGRDRLAAGTSVLHLPPAAFLVSGARSILVVSADKYVVWHYSDGLESNALG